MSAKRYASFEDYLDQRPAGFVTVIPGEEWDAAIAEGAARERERLLVKHNTLLQCVETALVNFSEPVLANRVRALLADLRGEA